MPIPKLVEHGMKPLVHIIESQILKSHIEETEKIIFS